jgi:hypothetical protein
MPDVENLPQEQRQYSPDELPLPELPPKLLRQIHIARARARDALLNDLNCCWSRCFPTTAANNFQTSQPRCFYGPFVTYGVTLYDAFAGVWLELKPDISKYQNWLNFGVKTLICDESLPSSGLRSPWPF